MVVHLGTSQERAVILIQTKLEVHVQVNLLMNKHVTLTHVFVSKHCLKATELNNLELTVIVSLQLRIQYSECDLSILCATIQQRLQLQIQLLIYL